MPVDRVVAWKQAHPERWAEIRRASARRCYVPRPRVLQTPAERKARVVARVKKWREKNPEKYAAQLARLQPKPRVTPEEKARHAEAQTRRVRVLKQQTPKWFERDAIVALYVEAREKGLTVDHIVPLRARNASGLHVLANLQLLPASENFRKRNRYAG